MNSRVSKLISDDKLAKHARDNDYLKELTPREKAIRQTVREPIHFLVKQGHLSTDHERAAQSITLAHRQIVAGIGIKTASMEGRVDMSRGGQQEDEAQRTIDLQKTYSLWWDAVNKLRNGPKKREVCLDIINMGKNLAEINRLYHIDHRTLKGWLKEVLNLFNHTALEVKIGVIPAAQRALNYHQTRMLEGLGL